MKASKIITYTGRTVTFMVLTVLTQIGGLVYVINISTYGFINQKVNNPWLRRGCKLGSFSLLYTIATFLIVPAYTSSYSQ